MLPGFLMPSLHHIGILTRYYTSPLYNAARFGYPFQVNEKGTRVREMNRTEAEERLYCAMTIGEELLVSGAEVNRVEDTIRRICTAYGAERVDVFTITSSIVTTIYGADFGACTQTRRVSGMAYDLNRLDALNRLSRRICSENLSPEEVRAEIKCIDAGPRYAFGMQLFIYALISGSFSIFFGGSLRDMLASALIGILLKLFESALRRKAHNALVTGLLCSSAGGLLAQLSVRLGLGVHADLIGIGNIMLLIPGIAFTNSLRDLFSGDTITGLIRFLESMLLAIVIALGFTLAGLLF